MLQSDTIARLDTVKQRNSIRKTPIEIPFIPNLMFQNDMIFPDGSAYLRGQMLAEEEIHVFNDRPQAMVEECTVEQAV